MIILFASFFPPPYTAVVALNKMSNQLPKPGGAADAPSLPAARNEMLTARINVWVMVRALREHELASQDLSPEKSLTEREAITLFIAREFAREKVSAKTLTLVFGIPFSGAANILRSLEKKNCIKPIQRGGFIEILPKGEALLSDFKSREATCWDEIEKELDSQDSVEAFKARTARFKSFHAVARRIFESRVFGAPKTRVQ
jgi:hypothetical protein